MTRFVTTAQDETEAKATELVDYLLTGGAPVNATTAQVRAIARLFQFRPAMKALADGHAEVDADALLAELHEELAKAEPDTIGARALQALGNWLLVGAGRVQEVRSI